MKRGVLIAGLLLLAVIWLGPLLDVYRSSFSAHMLAHMGVVAVAAPLVAIGISGTRWDVSDRICLFSPIPASLVELVVVWAWHAPMLRLMAQTSSMTTVLEQVSFIATGLFLWLSCLGGRSDGHDPHGGVGAFALLLTSVHMTLLGALLALSPRPLYGLAPVTCLGVELSADQDQQLGGVIMLMIGAAVYLAGGVTLLARLLASTGGQRSGVDG